VRQSPYHHVASTLEVLDGVTHEREASIGEDVQSSSQSHGTQNLRKSSRELIEGLGSSLQKVLL